ncbi:RNA-binding cell elongation regulator Jag/EloR [Streptococcus oricebi]|uniref:RNA-binding protein KhpB n=1 Tax=Streptococcus oricebi TaxID=1547447 RepID=A0ABS5B4S2_9STRE|nr:RNA-binding cell elongation regulator Jag/EloR [Streptococcus oricebi]MBP2623805.1 protein jag [Streptococcus oricebi]
MVVFTGASVEEAIQNGLNKLEIPRMKAHITVISREKKGFLGLFGKKPAQVDIEPINETTMMKANQKAVKGVPQAINEQNEPVKSVSEATVDLGKVVAAIKKVEDGGEEISEEVKAEILKNEKEASTILEETGTIQLLKEDRPVEDEQSPTTSESKVIDFPSSSKQLPEDQEPAGSGQTFADLGIEVEESYQIDEVVEHVRDYVQKVVDEMDVEASISSSYNRRTINMQIDTNEPGRVIGYHGKVLKALQLLAQNYLYNQYAKSFYISINVNDYVEHRAEVLQSYAQKLANRVLEYRRSQRTDPMSNNERKIIHRIISRMEGVTSYSEGDEPNRYVVVDIDRE